MPTFSKRNRGWHCSGLAENLWGWGVVVCRSLGGWPCLVNFEAHALKPLSACWGHLAEAAAQSTSGCWNKGVWVAGFLCFPWTQARASSL